jgi:recombination protein RecA
MVDVATKLMEADVDLIVVDSISALLPAIYFEKDGNELKDLQDTKQIGAEAKDMTHAVKMLNYANKNTLLVLISQQRNQFGSMHASHIPTGGMAVKFFSTTVIKLWSSEAEANAIKAGVKVGDKIIEQRVGRPVNWIVDYSKVSPPNLSGQYDFYYQGEVLGVDRVGETLDVAEMCGLVEKGGAWYTVDGERIQGRAKAVQYLRDNPEVVDKLSGEIDARS